MEDRQKYSPAKQVEPIKNAYFTGDEIRALIALYGTNKLDRVAFREIMHTKFDLTEDVMLDRIFRVFDTNNDGLVDHSEWINGLGIMLRGSLDEKINFAYSVYDMNGDKSLARDELYQCLKHCLVRTTAMEEDVDESVKDIVEIALRKLDTDHNGQVTFSDFQAAVLADPLLLEACGPCLPCDSAVAKFLEELISQKEKCN